MQCLDRFKLDALYQVGKEFEAVLLVLCERIFLVVAAQSDTGLEYIHLIEVVSPLRIEYLQVDDTLDLLALFGVEYAHLLFVEILHHTQDHLCDLVRLFLLEVSGIDIDQQLFTDERGKFFEVVILSWHSLDDLRFGKQVLDILLTVLFDLRADIEIRIKQLVSECVDDLSLMVGDIIILKDVFTRFIVLVFDLLLRLFYRTGDDLGVDILSLFDTETVHDVADLLSAKDAQQVVIEAEEKLTLSRITLTAGTTSQLVVDTA